MLSEHTIMNLSPAQHSMLIAHIDGPVEVFVINHLVRRALLTRRLLRGHPSGSIRPRKTILTEEGRRVVGVILGCYADALVNAGLLEQPNPLQVLRQLQAARRPGSPTFPQIPTEPGISDENLA